jgi:hypothetical protein
MKQLIKKLLRESLISEKDLSSEMKTAQEVGISDKIFYHGTRIKIDKIDPMFRQNNSDAMKGKSSGSANHGLGLYLSPNLGFDPNNLTYAGNGSVVMKREGADNAYKWAGWGDDDGYIYLMKLKPTATIIDEHYNKIDGLKIKNIEMNKYQILLKNSIDAVWSGGELVLLNPDAVQEFKLIYRIGTKYQIKGETLNKDEIEPTLKQVLGNKYTKIGDVHRLGEKRYYMYVAGTKSVEVFILPNQVIPV